MGTGEAVDPTLERQVADGRTREAQGLSRRERVAGFGMAGAFLAVAGAIAVLVPAGRHSPWWMYAVFVVAYAAASRVRFEVGSGLALPTELVLVPMLFELPARFVPVVVAGGLLIAALVEARLGRHSATRAVVVAAGSCWFAVGPALVFLIAGEPSADWMSVGWLAGALVAQMAFDAVSSTAGEYLAVGVHPRELVRPLAWAFAIDVLLAPVGFAAAIAETQQRGAALLPAPLLLLLLLFARERRRRFDHVLQLSSAYRGTALLLGDVVEADDHYTGEHSRQVVSLVLGVCERLDLDERELRVAEFTALLHDVGKIRIPADIINKPGPLTAEERAIVNTHTIEGQHLLSRIGGLLAEVGELVRSCHERWDGGGYPDGFAGEDIPLISRIVCCCDAYNAMVTDRPYRPALKPRDAIAELRAHRGTQFDPTVVDALLDVLGTVGGVPNLRAQGRTFDACPSCGRATLLDEPDGLGHRVCLHCGPVAVHA